MQNLSVFHVLFQVYDPEGTFKQIGYRSVITFGMQVRKCSIFNTVKQNHLSFNILDDFKKFKFLFFSLKIGMIFKEFFNDFFRCFSCFIAGFAFFKEMEAASRYSSFYHKAGS
jgi:hypothetical protein